MWSSDRRTVAKGRVACGLGLRSTGSVYKGEVAAGRSWALRGLLWGSEGSAATSGGEDEGLDPGPAGSARVKRKKKRYGTRRCWEEALRCRFDDPAPLRVVGSMNKADCDDPDPFAGTLRKLSRAGQALHCMLHDTPGYPKRDTSTTASLAKRLERMLHRHLHRVFVCGVFGGGPSSRRYCYSSTSSIRHAQQGRKRQRGLEL
ncbi:hypothetical protein K491DRAFT_397115 [Lophiostoma macrostomum CBS 122681]|uniref:Uncharacterized protein n=1 Tax=Lophiostoma macrostomum CBS 122681 TaxID=1314788 RepID=A0A6A6TC86_9PLEO|nr:hypothetical protein K491DRAFT_397115 [Lophiostoma macrostomum CBS 122681]